MRSTSLFRAPARAAMCAAATLAAIVACKTSTASGGAAGGETMMMDARGMMGTDARVMMEMGGARSMERDVGQGAGTAAGYGAVSSAASGADAARSATSGAAAAVGGGAFAVASSETPGAADAGGTGTAGTATAGSGQLSDAQIAAIAVAANEVDIEAGRAATKKTKNAKVRTFANDMIRDHTSANKQAAALVKKLGVTPEENDTSRGITQGGKDNLANLKSMKGKEFDRAYAEHEVAYHQQVLDALDQKLIPGAQNAELKSLLQSVRAVIAQHLDHATALAKELSK